MRSDKRKLEVTQAPDGQGLQISYQSGSSRKIHHIASKILSNESDPHGAGSYHDPEQHRIWMDRVDALIRKSQ